MTFKETEIKHILLRAELLGKKNWLQAVDLLEKATDEYPRERAIYLTLGDIYMRNKKFSLAIDSYQKALTINSKDEHLMFVIGNCYLSLNDYKMALYYYNQVSDLSPELHYNKALAYAYNNEHVNAVHNLKQLLKIVSDNQNIFYFLIEEQLRLHKYDEAIQWLDTMEKKFGLLSYQQILKGFVWNFKKIWLKSYMAFKNADELSDISNPDHLHSYAQACWQIGQINQAVELLYKAIGINPQFSLLYEDLIRIYIQQSNVQKAESTLKQAIELFGTTDPIYTILKEKIDKMRLNTTDNLNVKDDKQE